MSFATHFFCSLLFYEYDLKLEKEINICFIKDAFILALSSVVLGGSVLQPALQAAQTPR